MTSTLPVGRGLKQSLKKNSPAIGEGVRRGFTGSEPEVEQPLEELRGAVGVGVGGRVGESHRRAAWNPQVRRRHAGDGRGLGRADCVRRGVVGAREHDGVVDDASFDRRTRDRPADHRRRRGCRRRQSSADLERPKVVATRSRIAVRNSGSTGIHRDVLLAIDFIGDRAGTDRRSRLEAPQLIAILRVEREEIAIGLPDEQQVGCGSQDAVAMRERIRHPLLPPDAIGGRIDRDDSSRLIFARRAKSVAGLR